jgi:hypothetical protein
MGRRMLLTRPAALQRGAGGPLGWASAGCCAAVRPLCASSESNTPAPAASGVQLPPSRCAWGLQAACGVPTACCGHPQQRRHHQQQQRSESLTLHRQGSAPACQSASRCARHGVTPISTQFLGRRLERCSQADLVLPLRPQPCSCPALLHADAARRGECAVWRRLLAARALRAADAGGRPAACSAALLCPACLPRRCTPRATLLRAKLLVERPCRTRAAAVSPAALQAAPRSLLSCAALTGQLPARRCHRRPARAARCLLRASGVKFASARVPPRAKACEAARQCVRQSRRSPPTRPEQQPLAQLPARRASAASRSGST